MAQTFAAGDCAHKKEAKCTHNRCLNPRVKLPKKVKNQLQSVLNAEDSLYIIKFGNRTVVDLRMLNIRALSAVITGG